MKIPASQRKERRETTALDGQHRRSGDGTPPGSGSHQTSVTAKQMEELGALLRLIEERHSSGTASELVYFKGIRVSLHVRNSQSPDGMLLRIISTYGAEVLELVPAVTLQFDAETLGSQSVHETIDRARDWLDREVRRVVPAVQQAKVQLLTKQLVDAEQTRQSTNAFAWNRSGATEAAE
ncbi:hypothetical protein [Rhodococcus erythropolis]|uniref:Uncharacterized protein n=1 Tax=Rhodococcus erythropolis (strain PR4 / NBRC 100887) TaxID=234621 RepID=C1A0A5_RHOE4|nr:hypothetical protein [Rhodococcus erythropolis]BAH34040.1 hypothetical protein RER_33320 [Rhodococcus erythropolis PR4]